MKTKAQIEEDVREEGEPLWRATMRAEQTIRARRLRRSTTPPELLRPLVLALALLALPAWGQSRTAPPFQEVGPALHYAGRIATQARKRPVTGQAVIRGVFDPTAEFMFLPGQFEARYGFSEADAVPIAECYVSSHAAQWHQVREGYPAVLQALGLLSLSPDLHRQRDLADLSWTCSASWLHREGVRLGLFKVEAPSLPPPPAPEPEPEPEPPPPPADPCPSARAEACAALRHPYGRAVCSPCPCPEGVDPAEGGLYCTPEPEPPPVRTCTRYQGTLYVPDLPSTGTLSLELAPAGAGPCPEDRR